MRTLAFPAQRPLIAPPPIVATKGSNSDVFAARLDGSGNGIWARAFGEAEEQRASDFTVDCAGNALITGSTAGPIAALSVDFQGALNAQTDMFVGAAL